MKIAIAGATGRMGRTLIEAVLADPELSLAAALEAADSPALGTEIAGVTICGTPQAPSASVAAARNARSAADIETRFSECNKANMIAEPLPRIATP